MRITPNKIYLQADPEGEKAIDWIDGITWCEDQINDTDIKYIRVDLIDWYFETMDAMVTVHGLLFFSKHQSKRYGAYRRLAIMAGEAEHDLRELIK